MKVTIDKDLCTGCELCVSTAPDVFEMGDDNLARAKGDGTVPAGSEDAAREAAANCPVECIKLA